MKISILGYGWLGQAVAKRLSSEGHQVVASTTSRDKLDLISVSGVIPELFSLPIANNSAIKYQLFDSDVLIIMLPPQLRSGKRDYPDKIREVVKLAKKGEVNDIILISTTAVYNGLQGKVTEESLLELSEEKVALIDKAESLVLNYSAQSKVVRAAGLIDEQRHPGRFFAKDRALKQPLEPVNLVHKSDIANIVVLLATQRTDSKIFNVASNTHVTKEAFYSLATQVYCGQSPTVEQSSKPVLNRIISSEKVRSELDYQFEKDDLVEWLKRGLNEAD